MAAIINPTICTGSFKLTPWAFVFLGAIGSAHCGQAAAFLDT
jgi:hypothetical protein